MLLGVWADCRPSEGPRSRSEKPCSPAVRAQRAAIQPPCLLLRFIKKFGPATDAGATNFVRSTQAHSGLQCPELAQLRPQIVPWSTLCRADWVRNHPVPRAAGCYATTTQFLRGLRGPAPQRARHGVSF